MKKSTIFFTNRYKEIVQAIIELVNSQPDFISLRTAVNTWTVGDTIQTILSKQFQPILGDLCAEYSAMSALRATADLAFTIQYAKLDIGWKVSVICHKE